MHDWRSLVRSALPALTSDPARNAEILDELAHHLADTYNALVESGLSDREAFDRAMSELEATAGASADLRHAANLSTRTKSTLGTLGTLSTLSTLSTPMNDVRFAARVLRRSPGFTIATMITLALAIGATTAIFSVVQGVLLRPLPYREPDRLVRIWEVRPRGNDRNVVSVGNYLDWRDRARSFDVIGAYSGTYEMALTGDGDPLSVAVSRVTPSAFAALGVTPQAGRLFSDDEGKDGAARAALLSDALWRQRFGADLNIVGRTIDLSGDLYTVVGVMRPEFRFPDPDIDTWIAQQFSEQDRAERRSHNYGVVARLKESVSIDAAAAEMRTVAQQITAEQPAFMTGWGVNVVPLHADMVDNARPLIVMLFGVVIGVLLVACANLANLTLARATGRLHEIAVRSALGASRARIAAQLLTESLVLAGIGGAAGVVVVAVMLKTLIAAVPEDIPLLHEVRLDPVVFIFATAITVLSAVLVGLIPALRVGGSMWYEALASSSTRVSTTGRASRIRAGLVVAQVALALVLLVGAGLLVRSFIRMNMVDYGFRPDGLLAVSLDIPRVKYPDRSVQSRFYERALERVRTLPGVAAASTTSEAPASGVTMTFSFAIEGRPARNPSGREDPVPLRAVMPDYFQTLGIPLISGRAIATTDREDSPPVVLFNESLAKRFWKNGDEAVGRRVSFVGPGGPWYEIAGVVGDTRDDGLDQPAPPAVYVPYAQRRQEWAWLTFQTLVVRAQAGQEPSDLLPSIRGVLREIDPLLPMQTVRTVTQLYSENAARRRFAMQLTAGFALLALLLGAIGIYAVVAYSVAQRRREIGIRLALGAQPRAVARQIVRGALGLASAGAALGAISALALTRFLETLLFGVEPTDAATFVGMAALLLAIAALASWLPARRAMRVDPVEALRTD
jgi:putative ABC transport system permease protein